jgi:hypothetical protein
MSRVGLLAADRHCHPTTRDLPVAEQNISLGENIMDDKSRRKLRRTAKWFHWIVQIIIGVLLILRIFLPELMVDYGDAVLDSMTKRSLMTPAHALSNTIVRSAWARTHDLTRFLPPSDDKNLEAWAQDIETYFDQPLAIFYYDSKTVRWPRLAEQFAEIQDRIDALLKSGITCTPAAPNVRKMGTMFVQRASFDTLETGQGEAGTDRFSATIVGTAESSVRWGIIYDYKEEIYPFVRRLEKLKKDGSIFNDLSVIDGMFFMRRHPNDADKDSVNTNLYGLRIYQAVTDSILFATPDLDTTNYKYHYKMRSSFPWWIEIYDSDRGEMRRENILDLVGEPTKLLWIGFAAVNLFTMFVLALLYRSVLKATKPE